MYYRDMTKENDIWQERYERKLQALFELCGENAAKVAEKIGKTRQWVNRRLTYEGPWYPRRDTQVAIDKALGLTFEDAVRELAEDFDVEVAEFRSANAKFNEIASFLMANEDKIDAFYNFTQSVKAHPAPTSAPRKREVRRATGRNRPLVEV